MIRLRGVALITALLLTALAGSVAAGLAWDNALDVRRTMVMLHRDQAIQVAVGSEGWVRSILRDDAIQTQTDHLDEVWATDIPALPIDSENVQGQIYGKLEDLQGRFNVNNLIDTNGDVNQAYFEQFQRLLAVLELDPAIADATVDWLDPNQNETIPGGGEDPLYTGFMPAYRTADRPISNITELSAVSGMDRVSFEILLPHVIALPGRTAINVNTASVQVLQSLGPNIDLATAEGLVDVRKDGGFADISGTFAPLVAPDLAQAGFGENSEFFQLKAVVQIDTVRVSLFTVFHRAQGSGEVTPILRSLGTI
jgi:general secretion pathway protein K